MEGYIWEDVYPELVNKIRWAICTTFGTPASRYPYGVAQRIATVLAQDAMDTIKLSLTEPGVLSSTGSIRGLQAQTRQEEALKP